MQLPRKFRFKLTNPVQLSKSLEEGRELAGSCLNKKKYSIAKADIDIIGEGTKVFQVQ
jgi:hypothetical protein